VAHINCLTSLLANWENYGEKLVSEEKKKYDTGLTRAAKAGQKSLVPRAN
jgi:hypothetical protein